MDDLRKKINLIYVWYDSDSNRVAQIFPTLRRRSEFEK